ncbi:hypothetical protein [Pseudomonas phoenicis]|uniref:hypothetical protein n=1 Tax=unclassified Pseudomonas TaxID=196821 RepID=UPI0039A2DB0A
MAKLDAYTRIYTGGLNQLTLNREHVVTLNRYYEYATALPTDAATLGAGSSAAFIASSGLSPLAAQSLFDAVREHAAQWPLLAGESTKLASYLASEKTVLPNWDDTIIAHYPALADGDRLSVWQTLSSAAPVKLAANVKADISSFHEAFEDFQGEMIAYTFMVARISEQAVTFRRGLSEQLIPALKKAWSSLAKSAIARDGSDAPRNIDALDSDVEQCAQAYLLAKQKCLDALMQGVADVDKDLQYLEARLRHYKTACQKRSEALRALPLGGRVENTLTELVLRLVELGTLLEDVRTAANHLHTAWGSIGTYISEALERVQSIEDSQALATFMINYLLFRRCWDEIRGRATQVTAVFAEANNHIATRTSP